MKAHLICSDFILSYLHLLKNSIYSVTSTHSSSITVSTPPSTGKHRALFDSGMWEFLDLSAEPVLVELDPSIPHPAQVALNAYPPSAIGSKDRSPPSPSQSPFQAEDRSTAVSSSSFLPLISASVSVSLLPPPVENNTEPDDPGSAHQMTVESAASSSSSTSSSSKAGSRSSSTAPSMAPSISPSTVKADSCSKPTSEDDLLLTAEVTALGVAVPDLVAGASTSGTAALGTDNIPSGLGVEKRIKKRARDPEMDSYSSFPSSSSSSSSSASSSSSSSSSSYFTSSSAQYQSSNSSKPSTYSSSNKYSR
jgi:hypothetical protein